MSASKAQEQGAGGGVLAAKCPRGQEGGTSPDGLQRSPERREHTPGRAGDREGQVALVQGMNNFKGHLLLLLLLLLNMCPLCEKRC